MNKAFPFYHWFTTLLVAPFFLVSYDFIVSPAGGEVEMYMLVLLFSIFLSIPSLLFYCIIFYLLSTKKVRIPIAKIILLAFVVISIIITFKIIGGIAVEFAIAYSMAAVVTGLILKLKSKDPLPNRITER